MSMYTRVSLTVIGIPGSTGRYAPFTGITILVRVRLG
jgi:hypothetical protein